MPESVPGRGLLRSGAIAFILWGVLHLASGAFALVPYATGGTKAMLEGFGATDLGSPSAAFLTLVGHIGVDFAVLLMGYGLLAIWGATLLLRGNRLGFWLNTVLLAIADGAFVLAFVVPGHIDAASGLIGPALYLLGVGLSAWGLARVKASRSAESA
jgi:hypothetical protein